MRDAVRAYLSCKICSFVMPVPLAAISNCALEEYQQKLELQYYIDT